MVRQAIESYLDDFEDVAVAVQALQDPADLVLDCDGVRGELLGPDEGEFCEATRAPVGHRSGV